MHVRELRANGFKRFTDLNIRIDGTPGLVVMCGPNGSGKSSIIEALWLWSGIRGGGHWSPETDYQLKVPTASGPDWQRIVEIEFHESTASVDPRKAIYARTAYRNDPEFMLQQLSRAGDPLDARKPRIPSTDR